MEQFVRFADSKGVKRRNILIQKSYKLLEKNLFGNIIYNMLGLEAYLQYFNKTDATVIKGIEILEKGEAFPKAPVAVEEEVTKDKKDGKKKRTAQAYSITEDPTRGFNYAKEVPNVSVTRLIISSVTLPDKNIEQLPEW